MDLLGIIVFLYSNIGKTLQTSENTCKICHLQISSIILTTEELDKNIMAHIMYPLKSQKYPWRYMYPSLETSELNKTFQNASYSIVSFYVKHILPIKKFRSERKIY